jgi:hypothetical protein
MQPFRTCSVIADWARTRALGQASSGGVLQPVMSLILEADHAPTHEIDLFRTGRTFRSIGASRSAMVAPSRAHRQVKKKLAAAAEASTRGGCQFLCSTLKPLTGRSRAPHRHGEH